MKTDSRYLSSTPPKKLLWWILAFILLLLVGSYVLLSPDTMNQDGIVTAPEVTETPAG